MEKYYSPEGYILDVNTGLYYSQVIAEGADGVEVRCVTWFNADTGEYSQYEYPMDTDTDYSLSNDDGMDDIRFETLEQKSTEKSKVNKKVLFAVGTILFVAIFCFVIWKMILPMAPDSNKAENLSLSTDIEHTSADSTEVTLPDGKLIITLNGENEATISLTDESVGALDSVKEGDETHLLNSIDIFLFPKEGENGLQMWINDIDSAIYEENFSEVALEDGWYLGEQDGACVVERTNMNYSMIIKKPGIATTIRNCETYRVEFLPENHGNLVTIEEGNTADILVQTGADDRNGQGEAQEFNISFYDKNTVKFQIPGEEAKTAFYNYDSIEVRLYENEERLNHHYYTLEFATGQMYSQGKAAVNGYSLTPDENREGHNLAEGTNGYENLSGASADAVGMKFQCDNLEEMIRNTRYYEVYISDDLAFAGYVEDAINGKESIIPAIPEDFPVNKEDDNYFTPDTEMYRIIMVEMPYVIDMPEWYTRYGNVVPIWHYGVLGEREPEHHNATVVMLESYDEIGICSVKTKIVYEDAKCAMYAGTDGGAPILTNLDAKDESLVTPEALDATASNFYENSHYDHWYLYKGRYDNVKYFFEEANSNSTDEPILVPVTAGTDCGWGIRDYLFYNNIRFEIGEVVRYSETVPMVGSMYSGYNGEDSEYKITTYCSKSAVSLDYEAEAAKYNTAPDDWNDHPYAQYIPELPTGITFDYLEGQTINEESLNIWTGSDGCTYEQALAFFEKFRKTSYKEIRYEIDNDNEISFIIGVGDGVYIGARWRKDEQSLGIFGYKE